MAFSRNHALTMTAPDDPAFENNPSDWNAAHAITDAVSGGIPYFSSTTTEGTSALLAAGGLVVGGGAGTAPLTYSNLTYSGAAGLAVTGTAGTALALAGGTLTAAGSAFSLTGTINFDTSAINWVDWTFTDNSSHANTNAFRIRGGASGTAALFSVHKDSGATITSSNGSGQVLVLTSTYGTTTFGRGGSLLTVNSGTIINGATQATSLIELNHSGGSVSNIGTVGTNALLFGGTTGTVLNGNATTRVEINKAVTAFSDGVAKTVFTLTIPNAAHSASYLVRVTGSIGAGGAIGANEASATNAYIVTLTRTAGVNATGNISAAFGASATAVAGATTVTCTAALAAVSGGVGASNTIDIQATITKGGGSSDNHTCVATASLLNANATGVTIA